MQNKDVANASSYSRCQCVGSEVHFYQRSNSILNGKTKSGQSLSVKVNNRITPNSAVPRLSHPSNLTLQHDNFSTRRMAFQYSFMSSKVLALTTPKPFTANIKLSHFFYREHLGRKCLKIVGGFYGFERRRGKFVFDLPVYEAGPISSCSFIQSLRCD